MKKRISGSGTRTTGRVYKRSEMRSERCLGFGEKKKKGARSKTKVKKSVARVQGKEDEVPNQAACKSLKAYLAGDFVDDLHSNEDAASETSSYGGSEDEDEDE